MKKLISSIAVLIFLLPVLTRAQHLTISPEMGTQLRGKKKFSAIMQVVDAYYTSHNYRDDRKLFSEYKKWNRWAWFAVRHLNAAGEVDYNSSSTFSEAAAMQNHTGRPESNSGQWAPIGPTSTTWAINRGSRGIGRVDRLAFLSSNQNVILAATPAGGLWRTDNGGTNWFSISSAIPNCGISGILFSNNDPTGNTIYMLTGDGDTGPAPGPFVSNFGYLRTSIGVLSTTDGGITWQKTGNSEMVFSTRRCYKLLQVRNFPNILLAATDNGIVGSNNFGATWTVMPGTNFQTYYDIEQHPTNDAVIYCASQFSISKSVDYGQSYSFIGSAFFTPSLSATSRTALAVTAASPDEVYFLQCASGTPAENRIYKSINLGNNFSMINNTDLITGQYTYNCAFAVSPATNSFIAAGGINVSVSFNNGSTFPNITNGNIGGTVPANYVHTDIHDVAFNPVSGLLYAAGDGGVSVSNGGVNWTDISNGLQCTQYYHADGFNGTANLFTGGAQDNGTTFTANGSTMNYFGSGDGFAVDFPATDNDYIYHVENSNVTRYRRSANTRTDITPGIAAEQTFYPNIIAHPTDNNIVYVGYGGTMWRSNQKGDAGSWTKINATNGTSGGGAGQTGGFAVSAQLPNRLYAANATQLWRSDNQGTAFTLISGNTGWPANFGVMTDLAARNTNANEIWVTTTGNNGNNRVLYSSNGGTNWADYTGTLPNVPVYSIVCADDGDVYVGTELGVYFMDFSMNDWVPFYNGLPMVPVSDLFIDEINGTIMAATFGRGIWQSDLYSNCSPLVVLTTTVNGRNFYQSSGLLQSTQKINGNYGNELRYRSSGKISLKPGFKASAGSYLHAVIGPCGQGVFNRNKTEPAKTKAEALNLPGQLIINN